MRKFIYVIEAVASMAMVGSTIWNAVSWARARWSSYIGLVHKNAYNEGYSAAQKLYCKTEK